MQDLKLRLNLMTPKLILDFQRVFKRWSVMQDSNLRPLGPKPSALPSCANHRFLQFTLHWDVMKMGWLKGLEPSTTGITIRGSTN
jgi:hypothetical protein